MQAPGRELDRQYRVAKQMLGMHSDLRDQYARLGLTAELVLLLFAVVSCATTFASDSFYAGLHLDLAVGRFCTGLLAIIAFAGAVALLVVNPKGKSEHHRDAAEKWWKVVEEFRCSRKDDGSWPPDGIAALVAAYARVCDLASPIPDRQFNRLKSRYLRKVEVSRLKDSYPGCPIMVLRLLVRGRDTLGAVRAFVGGDSSATSNGT